jgi:CheY-like chemotaxis protein
MTDDDLSVIVVDSDRDARELYRQSLVSGGIRVHEAIDGRDALAQVYSVRPDAIVLDARLPFIDGLQLCALLRSDATTASLRIIAVTSDATPEHVFRLRNCGADAVFVKPVPVDELRQAILDRRVLTPTDGRGPAPRAAVSVRPSRTRALAKAKSHERYVSTNPPQAPPHLRCPQCDSILQYERSHIGGVSERHPEQWDYYVCAVHGTFQYRHRTRKLRAAS